MRYRAKEWSDPFSLAGQSRDRKPLDRIGPSRLRGFGWLSKLLNLQALRILGACGDLVPDDSDEQPILGERIADPNRVDPSFRCATRDPGEKRAVLVS